MTAKSTLEFNREKKKLKRRKQKLASYYKTKPAKTIEYKTTKEATKKRKYRERNEKRREKERIKKRKYRESKRSLEEPTEQTSDPSEVFSNRTSKHRAIKKLRQALPTTPKRRSATLVAYLKNSKSPTVESLRNDDVISSPEDDCKRATESSVFEDIKIAVSANKMKRSKDAVTTMNVLLASVSGEKVKESKSKKQLAKKLGLPIRRISKGHRIRTNILKSENSSWTYTCRKTRSDALSNETKRLAYDFWTKPGISRPTANKSDIKRERIGPKMYTSHMVYVLEKTQTEVYLEFNKENPSIKLSQRCFENCKPYFVRQVRQKDRQTCCCRYHIEIKSAFKSCMEFRKNALNSSNIENTVRVYENVSDIVDATLCCKQDDAHNISCLRRNCDQCGLHKLELLPEEKDNSQSGKSVKWERFEKIAIKVKGNKTIKKLVLVKKESKAGDLFSHLLEMLKVFPLHQHRATWQNNQYQTLISNLPQNDCVCVHDFSENYRCSDLCELQSSYFQKTEVSVHVSIIQRHAILEYDGIESTEDFPEIITEHFFVISDDLQHDQYFVHEARKQVSEYLKSISYPVKTMHEFTDGCAAQYKSRHCFGDISNTCQDFGYTTFTRNFFETSHAKGPQDAAGGLLKRQADIAVLRGRTSKQNAKDLFQFAVANMTIPKSHCKRRLFRYVEKIPRDGQLSFRPVPKIRSIHQVFVNENDTNILIRELSCFSCDRCMQELPLECENISHTGCFTNINMVKMTAENVCDNIEQLEDDSDCDNLSELVSEGQVIAVFADDSEFEYFLLKVLEKIHPLETEACDDWGSSYPVGTAVIRGLYYDSKKSFKIEINTEENCTCTRTVSFIRFIRN